MPSAINILFIIALIYPTQSVASGSTFTVYGQVISQGKPVPFANLALAEIQVGTSADRLGRFNLKAPVGSYTLLISSVGFQSRSIPFSLYDSLYLGILELVQNDLLLDPITVSATMRHVIRTESTVPIQVISSAAFQSDPSPSILGAVAQVNGVRPQLNCAVCATSDMHINGMEGPYTMVLIDGMPIVSGLGSVYGLNGIPTAMIEQIEVVKGPGSALYGSEAMGGIINIITKNPALAPRVSASSVLSDWGEIQTDVGLSIGNKEVTNLLGISTYWYDNPLDNNADGFTDLTIQKRISVFNKTAFKRTKNRTASLAARLVFEDRWGGDMDWTPAKRGSDSVYGESIVTERIELIGLYQLPVRETVFCQFSFNTHLQDSYYGTEVYQANQQIGFAQIFMEKKLSNHHDLLVGLSNRLRKYNDNTPATVINDLDKAIVTNIPGFFVQDEWSLASPTTLLGGYRIDLHQEHGAVSSPRIAFKYKPSGSLGIRAGIATGFRVVDVFTEDHAALSGSRDVLFAQALEPERSINATVNIVRRFPTEKLVLELDLTVFHSHFSNRIVADLDSDPNAIIYRNLQGIGVSQGISFDQMLRVGKHLQVRHGLSYMNVFNDQLNKGLAAERRQQLFAPAWSGTLNITYQLTAGLSASLNGQWNGPMRLPVLPNDPRPEYAPLHALFNTQLSYGTKKGIVLFGGVRNIFDFVPPYALLRPFDPFNQQVNDPINNPNNLTFDTSYMYASLQGRRAFFGIRYELERK